SPFGRYSQAFGERGRTASKGPEGVAQTLPKLEHTLPSEQTTQCLRPREHSKPAGNLSQPAKGGRPRWRTTRFGLRSGVIGIQTRASSKKLRRTSVPARPSVPSAQWLPS